MEMDLAIKYKAMSLNILKAYNLPSTLCILVNYLNVSILLKQMCLIDNEIGLSLCSRVTHSYASSHRHLTSSN